MPLSSKKGTIGLGMNPRIEPQHERRSVDMFHQNRGFFGCPTQRISIR
jgi:hypothetical protein